MSNLAIASSRLTMSSREIAELVNSRHDSVKRTIERCSEKKAIQLPPMVEVKNHLGQTVQEFNLCKRDSLIVVAQLCPEFTATIVDRWQELEDALAIPAADVRELQAPSKIQIGGIIKSVIHKELAEAIQFILPRMIEGAISKQQLSVRIGKTSGQIWKAYGLPPLKGAAVWLSNRLEHMGCLIDGGGRAELGGRSAKLFDPDKAEKAMKACGLIEHCRRYVTERAGQGSLKLIART